MWSLKNALHRVNNAIIMAAGKGDRLQGILKGAPKPLLKVGDTTLIDSILVGLLSQGILSVKVVVGYRAEAFQYLKPKYKELGMDIEFIFNKDYHKANNIASLYYAREYIPNSIILDGDLYIQEPKILAAEFEQSGYSCFEVVNYETKEWLLNLDSEGFVESCVIGGNLGKELISISYWCKDMGVRLAEDVKRIYEAQDENTMQNYWDHIPLFINPSNYKLGVRMIERGSVIEVDTESDYKNLNIILSRRAYE